ncbi:flavodoxin family protein [Desulfobaculum sp.]
MKTVTILNASPRKKGNSHAIANTFGETAQASGATVNTYELNAISAKGCQGCFACKGKTERCVVRDDLSQVLEAVHHTDVLVLASPVYFGDVAAQMKPFMDRLFHLFTPDFHKGLDHKTGKYTGHRTSRLPEGVQLVFIITQGNQTETVQADIPARYENFFRWLGFEDVHILRGLGDATITTDNTIDEVHAQARTLAHALTTA